MPGSYVAINEGADKWWNRYSDEAMQILGTVKIADGIIDKSQAIEIAKKGITCKNIIGPMRYSTRKKAYGQSAFMKRTGLRKYRASRFLIMAKSSIRRRQNEKENMDPHRYCPYCSSLHTDSQWCL